jgi:Arf-GAP/coiled-coil/ANK repeat/PH domain-containing protein
VLGAVPGNGFCADCDMPEPDWASLNLGIMLCLQCSGVHRQLGVQVSKVRSATLDVRAWEPSVLEFFSRWGNAQSNARWEYEKAEVEAKKPNKNSSLESRKAFILSKYVAKAFCRREAQPTESQLLTAINSNSLPAVMDLLLKGPHIKMHWVMLTAACDCGDASIAILEALLHHNVDVNARENPYTEDTALHYAARRGRDAFAKVLLRRGADPRVLNGRGQTAFDVAVDVHGAIRDEDLLIMLSAAQDDD